MGSVELFSSYEALSISELIKKELDKKNIDNADFLDLREIHHDCTLPDYLQRLSLVEVLSDNEGRRCFRPDNSLALVDDKVAASPTLQMVVQRRPALEVTPVGFDPCKPSGQFSAVTMYRGQSESFGLRFCIANGGVYVFHVKMDSPAAKAGLRFLDQITHIDDRAVTGLKVKEVTDLLKDKTKCKIVRKDRFQALNVQLTHAPDKPVGIVLQEGVIHSLLEGSSAANNGVPIGTHLIEVNGVNVVGFSDEKIIQHISAAGSTVALTLLNHETYKKLVKSLKKDDFDTMHRF
ncbi:hypothetical protein SprV_0602187100 [Sparganum proliferum]